MSDLRNCCSNEDLSTVPWCFFSSFITFLFSLKGEKITKEYVNKVTPSAYYITQKQLLVHMTYLVMRLPLYVMFLRVLY